MSGFIILIPITRPPLMSGRDSTKKYAKTPFEKTYNISAARDSIQAYFKCQEKNEKSDYTDYETITPIIRRAKGLTKS
jgi:hypothetical protein